MKKNAGFTDKELKQIMQNKFDNFDQVRDHMLSRVCTRSELEDNSKIPEDLSIAIDQALGRLKQNFQSGDEIWYYNDIQCLSGTWGYFIKRDGDIVYQEITGRS